MGGHGGIGANDVLGILIVTGVTIPALTAMRLYITLRAEKRKGRRTAATRWGIKVTGEGFLVVVALLSTVQVVLWGWNTVEELTEKADEGKPEDWAMVPGIPYLKVGLSFPPPTPLFYSQFLGIFMGSFNPGLWRTHSPRYLYLHFPRGIEPGEGIILMPPIPKSTCPPPKLPWTRKRKVINFPARARFTAAYMLFREASGHQYRTPFISGNSKVHSCVSTTTLYLP